jgi:hypothetical protein
MNRTMELKAIDRAARFSKVFVIISTLLIVMSMFGLSLLLPNISVAAQLSSLMSL